MLEGVFETRDLELCSRLNLWHVVHCEAQIDMLAIHKTHQGHRVFLKINTGMNRLGFALDQVDPLLDSLSMKPHLHVASSFTHLPDTSNPDSDDWTKNCLQAFEGVVIGKRNRGLNSAFTVRKISHGVGVERTFQTYSPLVDSLSVKRRGDVRQAKLYYLRELSGRAARIKEKLG